jgi:anaerobic dimethyl sulfoxide reductase subunit B (iron-sulfur subunit)
LDLGPFEINKDIKASGIDWYYIAAPTSLCDLCADRVSTGGIPTCQLHCLAGVIEYGPVDVLADKLKSSEPHKMNLFIP